jgi:thiol-disulfide isomerase/thioredoxin
MRLKLIIVALTILCGVAYALWDYHMPTPSIVKTTEMSQIVQMNSTVPNAHFTDLNGQSHTMHAFKGKIILINMWATWCPPCIEEFPSLLELADLKKDELIFIAFSSDRDVALIERFFNRLGNYHKALLENDNVIIVHDKDARISYNDFQTVKYPETFIIDKNLKIRNKISGGLEWTSEAALDLLAQTE